jgi:hypothetical protein
MLLAAEGRHGVPKQRIQPGDAVLVRKPRTDKLEKPWSEPTKVLKVLGPTVMDVDGFGPTHVNRLKLFQGG